MICILKTCNAIFVLMIEFELFFSINIKMTWLLWWCKWTDWLLVHKTLRVDESCNSILLRFWNIWLDVMTRTTSVTLSRPGPGQNKVRVKDENCLQLQQSKKEIRYTFQKTKYSYKNCCFKLGYCGTGDFAQNSFMQPGTSCTVVFSWKIFYCIPKWVKFHKSLT